MNEPRDIIANAQTTYPEWHRYETADRIIDALEAEGFRITRDAPGWREPTIKSIPIVRQEPSNHDHRP